MMCSLPGRQNREKLSAWVAVHQIDAAHFYVTRTTKKIPNAGKKRLE